MPFRWTGALTTRYDAKVGWETHLGGLIPLGGRYYVLVLGLLFRPRRLGRVGVACHRARPTELFEGRDFWFSWDFVHGVFAHIVEINK